MKKLFFFAVLTIMMASCADTQKMNIETDYVPSWYDGNQMSYDFENVTDVDITKDSIVLYQGDERIFKASNFKSFYGEDNIDNKRDAYIIVMRNNREVITLYVNL